VGLDRLSSRGFEVNIGGQFQNDLTFKFSDQGLITVGVGRNSIDYVCRVAFRAPTRKKLWNNAMP
jgi:hypothetical protein